MLHLIFEDTIISSVPDGGRFVLPNGDAVSPAYEGWEGQGYRLVAAPPPAPPTAEELLAEERANMRLSFPQLVIGLVEEQWITEADGDGWITGILPSTVMTTINLLPAEQRFAARAKAARPSYIDRMDPLVGMMALAQGRSPSEIDEFFRKYAGR
jgi:hypothetical protein